MSEPLMEKGAFLESLEARSRQYLQRLADGDMNEAYAALDLMRAISSAHHGRISDDEILAALPVKAWREDTVAIPFAFLRALAVGWGEYLEQRQIKDGKTLEQCLGLGGRFQGNWGISPKAQTRDESQRLANLVAVEIMLQQQSGRKAKVSAAIKHVADTERVSESKVRNAYRKYARPHLSNYRSRAEMMKKRG